MLQTKQTWAGIIHHDKMTTHTLTKTVSRCHHNSCFGHNSVNKFNYFFLNCNFTALVCYMYIYLHRIVVLPFIDKIKQGFLEKQRPVTTRKKVIFNSLITSMT